MVVRFTVDPVEAEAATRSYLAREPVLNNVVGTLLDAHVRSGVPLRCWWVDGGGVVFQAPSTFPAVLSVLSPDAIAMLAAAVAAVDDPPVGGFSGVAADAAAFAGAFATAGRRGVRPVEGQRIYEIRSVRPPSGVPGAMRDAGEDDVPLLATWIDAFAAETGDHPNPDPTGRARTISAAGRYQVWSAPDGETVSSAVTAPTAVGVARVGGVYTPPAHRGHGYAAALVAAMSATELAAGRRCILYTQLQNPTSNGVYQRIGYEPVAEVVRYEVV